MVAYTFSQFYKTYLIPQFCLEQPTLQAKDITNSGDLLTLLSFNYAYNQHIFPSKCQRLDLTVCYLILAYTRCWPAKIVDGEKPLPTNNVCWDQLFASQATLPLRVLLKDAPPNTQSKKIVRLLELETWSCGRPKALCYEDIQLMVVHLPDSGKDILTMSIKFAHHKGSDNRPKPYVSLFPVVFVE
jgi:hypothetical protein